MKLIVGLGNPGTAYEWTRHNAGKSIVAFGVHQGRGAFQNKKSLKASVAEVSLPEGIKVLIACPQTYMNLSGEAVGNLVKFFGVDYQQDLLVVVDDVALDFGRLRLRLRGTDGGHNGLKSIAAVLQSSFYPRLRVGIQDTASAVFSKLPLETYVLSRWSEEQLERWPDVQERAWQACRLWACGDPQKVMNAVNA